MAAFLEYAAGALLLIGALFSLLAAIGVLRFPDVYTRLHAAAKTGLVGAGLVLLAAAFLAGDLGQVLRPLAGIAFLVLTTPVAAHLLARAALTSGIPPANITVVNDLVKETDPR
ncbi:MAG: monovalent cation/H(+) antiporter subunit G [Devosia sp.]|jgi:multicomponent Na+:H+ antiporter subunit G